MVDLAQALSEIKSLPDHALQKELKSPSGSIPGWLALGEIHERKRIRATAGANTPDKRPSMAEEYAGSIQPLLAGAGMAQPTPPPQAMPSMGSPPPGGIAGLPPPPPAGLASMPQAPQGYAGGGIVRLAGGGILSYANQKATRNQMLTAQMEAYLQDAIANVYGPGYTAQIYSGGQTGERRTGSVRHNEGRAGDIYVIGPDGQKISGDALAPLGQYWAAKKYGGVGMEMHGGGIHLDEWATPPQGGGMSWNYADQGGQYTPAQQAAIEAGLQGQLPTLYGGQQVAMNAAPQMSIEQYIRARAPIYGIDPDIAVRVAQSEGGLSDILRQSDVVKGGQREQSYGPFQLYMQGGLGNRALEAGIDPRTQEGAWKGIDFALAEAGTKGWGQWYGAKRVGIDPMMGISGQGSRTPIYDQAGTMMASADPNAAVAQTAANTAGNMAATEGAAAGDPMSEYFLMQQLLAPQQPAAAPAPTQAMVQAARPVDARQFVQNPAFMQRRNPYGFA